MMERDDEEEGHDMPIGCSDRMMQMDDDARLQRQ